MRNLQSHPLHGVGCSMFTVWDTLNDMFDSTAMARADVISNHFTFSMVLIICNGTEDMANARVIK